MENAKNTNKVLQRVLGLRTLVAIIIGIAISQVALVSLLQATAYARNVPPLLVAGAFAAAFLLALSYVSTFSELALMMPSAGGLSTYTEVAIGHFPALLATFSGYVVVNLFGLPAELLLFDNIIREVFGLDLPANVIGLGLLALLTALNVLGTDVFALLQNFTTSMKILAVAGTGLIALCVEPPAWQAAAAPASQLAATGTGAAGLIALFVWCFVGAEFVCPMIEEARRPERDIPRSMLVALLMLAAMTGVYALGAERLLSTETMASSRFPHLAYAAAVFGRAGTVLITLTAIGATVGLVNAVLGGVSRMLYGMALDGQAFPFLARLHPRYGTPWAAIVFLAALSAVPMLALGNRPETITILVVSASTAWLLAYIVAHVDVIVLRLRYPHLRRPSRSPFFPLVQLAGIAGMAYAALNNSPSPELSDTVYLITGCVLGLTGLLSALWVRCVMKRPLFRPEPLRPGLLTPVDGEASTNSLTTSTGETA